jgi:hypothetical protein
MDIVIFNDRRHDTVQVLSSDNSPVNLTFVEGARAENMDEPIITRPVTQVGCDPAILELLGLTPKNIHHYAVTVRTQSHETTYLACEGSPAKAAVITLAHIIGVQPPKAFWFNFESSEDIIEQEGWLFYPATQQVRFKSSEGVQLVDIERDVMPLSSKERKLVQRIIPMNNVVGANS